MYCEVGHVKPRASGMSKPLLTPKDLADAIGVSESSMRRWVDSGRLKMTRTAGGHRRIEINEAIRFIRESGTPVVHPEILGLADITSATQLKGPDEQGCSTRWLAAIARWRAGWSRRGTWTAARWRASSTAPCGPR